jgi:hypothetical protein
MPLPIDLTKTKKRYGKLKVLRLTEEHDNYHRRLWLCLCDCGTECLASTMVLRNGHKTSCGRSCPLRRKRTGRPFNSRTAKAAHAARACVTDGGEDWLSPRAASEHVGKSQVTLHKWADRLARNGRPFRAGFCPLLGRAIETRPLPGGYNRMITYFSKKDLNLINKAQAMRVPGVAPDCPDLSHVDKAAEELDCHIRTLYRRAEGARERKSFTSRVRTGRGGPCRVPTSASSSSIKPKSPRSRTAR